MSRSTNIIIKFCIVSKVPKMGRIESFYLSYFFFNEFIAFSAGNLSRVLMLTKKVLCLQANSPFKLTGRFKIKQSPFSNLSVQFKVFRKCAKPSGKVPRHLHSWTGFLIFLVFKEKLGNKLIKESKLLKSDQTEWEW